MPPGHKPIHEKLHALAGAAMALWLGILLMTGVNAAISFIEMKELSPQLPKYAGHEEDFWSIAAGHAMMPAFRVTDIATLVLASVALALTAFTITTRRGRVTRLIWSIALAGAAGLGAHHALVRSPQMQRDVNAYWAAAEAGDRDTALEYKQTFDAAHPVASNVLKAESALLALAIAGWALAPRREAGTGAA